MKRLADMVGVAALVVMLAGCAAGSIAGTPGPASGTAPSGPYGSSCDTATTGATPAGPPITTRSTAPAGAPMITVTRGTNAWIGSGRTEPLAVAVYDDGTAIRSEDAGTAMEPIAGLTIGWIDPCRLADAVATIGMLAAADLGSPGVTDQGTTSVVLRLADGEVRVDAYALGIGDELLPAPQQDARRSLSALIDTLRTSMTDTAPWTPDRLRLTSYGVPADPAGALHWPLDRGIEQTLGTGRSPCTVLTGAEADAVLNALGGRSASHSWTDGNGTLVLALGPLVPGQQGCPA